MHKIKLWVKARDIITGFTGIVTAITKHLTGCDRATLTPQVQDKDGEQKLVDAYNFDLHSLEIVDEGCSKHFEKIDEAQKLTTETPRSQQGWPATRPSKSAY